MRVYTVNLNIAFCADVSLNTCRLLFLSHRYEIKEVQLYLYDFRV